MQPESGTENFSKRPHSAGKKSGSRNGVHSSETSTVLRLAFLVMLMIVVSFFAFYTIYWIVRCIHFIGAMRKLDTRRDSIIAAGQLDPELTVCARRGSRFSNLA